MTKKQVILSLFIAVLIAYLFYNFGVNSKNDEIALYRERIQEHQERLREQQQRLQEQQQKQEEEKYTEEVISLPGGMEISVLINKYTDKVEYWWHPSGWQPIANTKLNLQWAYDNRRTLRMLPEQ